MHRGAGWSICSGVAGQRDEAPSQPPEASIPTNRLEFLRRPFQELPERDMVRVLDADGKPGGQPVRP